MFLDILVSNYELVFKVLGRKAFMYPLVAANGFTSTSQYNFSTSLWREEVASVLPSTNAAITCDLSHHLILFEVNLDSLSIAVYSSPVGLLLLLHVASFTVCPAQL